MTAAAHRHDQLLLARKVDGRDYVGCAGAAGDERRIFVDHPVPDGT
jgi:hypothetical protein